MILPKGRTTKYAIWRGCERLGILPPDCSAAWDDCSIWAQANIVAYAQVRDQEDAQTKF